MLNFRREGEGAGNTVDPALNVLASLDVRNQRLTMLVAVLVIALVGMAVGWRYNPVKSVEPVYVRDDAQGGLQPLAAKSVTDFRAEQRHISHFLQGWVRRLQTINPELTRNNLLEANDLVVGTAIREIRDHLRREAVHERMERDPNLRRTVEIRSVAFPSQGAAIVFFNQTERSGAMEPRTQRRAATINFTFVPVETRADIERNPIGLRISHFEIADDQASQ